MKEVRVTNPRNFPTPKTQSRKLQRARRNLGRERKPVQQHRPALYTVENLHSLPLRKTFRLSMPFAAYESLRQHVGLRCTSHSCFAHEQCSSASIRQLQKFCPHEGIISLVPSTSYNRSVCSTKPVKATRRLSSNRASPVPRPRTAPPVMPSSRCA